MNQTALALLVGLLAGVGGALGVQLATGGGDGPAPGLETASLDLSDIEARLARIESALGQRDLQSSPALAGAGTASPSDGARIEEIVAQLEERLKPALQESVKASVKEAIEESGDALDEAAVDEPEKKKRTLAEVAAELNLTAAEEDAVRRIAAETTEEFLKLLTDENTTVDDLKREFEGAKGDPGKQAALGMKYMGKMLGNLGGLITVGLNHERKMVEAIGQERADRMDEEFEVTDLDPLQLETIFDDDK